MLLVCKIFFEENAQDRNSAKTTDFFGDFNAGRFKHDHVAGFENLAQPKPL
jgi:hypothetical protein